MTPFGRAGLLVSACMSLAAAVDCSFEELYPNQYVAYYTSTPPIIDGILDEPVWNEVGFTDPFVDIATTLKPPFNTSVAVRWDNHWLYVAARIFDNAIWANITHTCHCIDPNSDQVIFHDNAFEVFVDADGSNAYYKEYEMNAANATWDACLNRPYGNGGYENSTRVFGPHGFDLQPPLRAGTYIDGALNRPQANQHYWTVEIAMPLDKLAYNTSATIPPSAGDMWRTNFARVEWGVDIVDGVYWKRPSCRTCSPRGSPQPDYWVWAPMGAVNLHQPDKWGFLQFAEGEVNSTAPIKNPEWTVRSVAMQLYYAQKAYAQQSGGKYTSSIKDLQKYALPGSLNGTCSGVPQIQLAASGLHFQAHIESLDGNQTADIDDTRLLVVH